MKMSPLAPLVSRVSTVSGGGLVPVTVLGAMGPAPRVWAGPREHAEMPVTVSAQTAPAASTARSRGRDVITNLRRR